MADPPPLPVPWTPAPTPPSEDQWQAPPPVNLWDLPALLAYLQSENAARLKDALGQDISLIALLDLFTRYNLGAISDQELVQVIEMGSYFARTKMQWTEAAANLDYWLVAGHDPRPERRMKHELILNRDSTATALCGEYYDLIVTGVSNRLKATPGQLFPPASTTITGASGETITLSPTESPLAAGGEENLYIEQAIAPTESHLDDIYNAVGGVWLVSRVKVKSEKLTSGGWRVTIIEWECWFWDNYDWGLSGQSVSIPLNLFERLGIPNEQRTLIETNLHIDTSSLDNLTVGDKTMLQIEGKQVDMPPPDGRQFRPKAYRIYGDKTWRFDPSGEPCSRDMTWVVQ